MICGHEFEQGQSCNREISFRMGFKLGMCSPCYNLTQHKKLMREEARKEEERDIILTHEQARERYRRSIICEGSVIYKGATISKGAMIHKGATIHKGAVIGVDAVVYEDAVIYGRAVISQGVVIHKDVVINSGTVVEKKEKKKVVNVAIRHRLSKLGVRY